VTASEKAIQDKLEMGELEIGLTGGLIFCLIVWP
jgi:hypothetical protein